MSVFSKLILTLLTAFIIPSTLAALNGKCTGRDGICISSNDCSKYSGRSFTGKCPNDANNIRCCDNIPCTTNDGRTGNCVFTNQCSGEAISGKCPGGNDFKCCVSIIGGGGKTGGKYFTIAELTRSDTATRQGIDNTPSQDVKEKLLNLIINCLDPIREIYGKPIIVTSGYRCERLNKAVGGATNSQHKKGEAADLVPGSGGNLKDLYRAIIKFGKFDQLIFENDSWAHVSYTNSPRRQILKFDGSSYKDITNSVENYL